MKKVCSSSLEDEALDVTTKIVLKVEKGEDDFPGESPTTNYLIHCLTMSLGETLDLRGLDYVTMGEIKNT
jgi:hypothetical protein